MIAFIFLMLSANVADTTHQAYFNRDWDRAQQGYEAQLKENDSGHLYYNLGNVYFSKGEMGKALLHYEKAKRRIPRDMDVRANLKFVQTKLGVGEGPRMDRLVFWNDFYTLPEGVWAFLILWGLTWIALLFRSRARGLFWGITFLFIFSASSLCFKALRELVQNWGVVLHSTVVHPNLFEEDKVLFQLNEGEGIQILDHQDFKQSTFYLIQSSLGRGWASRLDIGGFQ